MQAMVYLDSGRAAAPQSSYGFELHLRRAGALGKFV